jgi:hypothetical protein
MDASYTTRKVVATVVNSDVMEEVVSAMKKALSAKFLCQLTFVGK